MALFSSSLIQVDDETIDGDTSSVVVTFPTRAPRQRMGRTPFGADFLRSRNISAIHLSAASNHWFQIDEMDAAITAVRHVTSRFQRVVAYGSSMGGYGAALYSRAIGAQTILLMCPQFTMNPVTVPWETRWQTDIQAIPAWTRDDMAGGLALDADLWVFYDSVVDGWHARTLLNLSTRPHAVPMPFGGHPVTQFMKEAGMLGWSVSGIIQGSLTAAEIRNRTRQSRAKSVTYWTEKTIQLWQRSPSLALEAARQAAALTPNDHAVQFRLGRALWRSDQAGAAVAALTEAIKINPSKTRYREELNKITQRMSALGILLGALQHATGATNIMGTLALA